MNKFQKVSLAAAIASSMAFADVLWDVNSAYGQVQFPWILECQSGTGAFAGHEFFEDNENDLCYKTLGGWWFGYLAGDISTNPNNFGCGASQASKVRKSGTATVKANLKLNKGASAPTWISFVGPDYEVCQGPAITDKTDGTSLMGSGLELKLITGEGLFGVPAVEGGDNVWEPSIAAFAVNFSTDVNDEPPPIERNFSDKPGFCLSYISDHTTQDVAVELGWDEVGGGACGDQDGGCGFDTWYAPVASSPGVAIAENYYWDDFVQEGWSATDPRPGPYPIEKAIQNMKAFKVRFKSYVPDEVNFTILEFGWAGTCGNIVPIATSNPSKPSVNFELIGKVATLSVNKSASVQIINLHGAVVHTQTVEPGAPNRINLNKLPTGVYLIRVPALGYVNKIAVR